MREVIQSENPVANDGQNVINIKRALELEVSMQPDRS